MSVFNQLEDQINAGTDLVGLDDSSQKLPEGIKTRDVVVNMQNGELKVGIFNGKSVVYASFGSFTGAITDAQHGTRSGGLLHALATSVLNGFMSGADKAKLDNFKGDTSSAVDANLTNLPNDGDWCFHTNTAAVTYKLAKNKSGIVYSVALA